MTSVTDVATGRLVFSSHGARIAVHAQPADLIERVRDVLPPGSSTGEFDDVDTTLSLIAPAGTATVEMDGRPVLRGIEVDRALRGLGDAFHYGVAAHSRTHIFLHAGVVQWKDRAILLPGESRCGKSTLVDALLHAGASYFSDECAPLDDDSLVHPYRKPLRLRRDRWPLRMHGKGTVSGVRRWTPAQHADAAMSPAVDAPLEIGMILLARFREGAVFEPRRITPGRAVLCMAAHCIPAATRPDQSLAVLTRVATRAPAYVADRGEAERTAEAVLALMEGDTTVGGFDAAIDSDFDLSPWF